MSKKQNPRIRFRKQEETNIGIVRKYLDDAKSNYTRLECARSQIEQQSAKYLHANNGHARMAFTEIVFDRVAELVGQLSSEGVSKMYMLTIAPSKFAMSEHEARHFKPEAFQQHMDEWFGKFDMFGVIEAGFYPRMTDDAKMNGGTVSFHGHCLVWGAAERTLQRAAELYRTANTSFLETMQAAHLGTLPIAHASDVIAYSFKSPQNKYGVLNAFIEKVDEETGELVEWLYQKQMKEIMRPGERIKTANVLADQYLDYLVLHSGTGTSIAEDVFIAARRGYPEHEERKT